MAVKVTIKIIFYRLLKVFEERWGYGGSENLFL